MIVYDIHGEELTLTRTTLSQRPDHRPGPYTLQLYRLVRDSGSVVKKVTITTKLTQGYVTPYRASVVKFEATGVSVGGTSIGCHMFAAEVFAQIVKAAKAARKAKRKTK